KIILLSLAILFSLSSCMTTKLERVEANVEEIPQNVEESLPEETSFIPLEEVEEEVDREELSVLYSDGEFNDFKSGEVPALPIMSEPVAEIVETEVEEEEKTEAFSPIPQQPTSSGESDSINGTIAYLILVLFLLISVFGLVSIVSRGKKKDGGERQDQTK
ncbi:MAG: hypothetical protein ACI4S4_05730, partial [Candidatus Ornithospirochaeta sp.]